MSHRNRMKMMCRDGLKAVIEPHSELTCIIEPVEEIVAIIESVATGGSSLNENELLKIYQQGKEDYYHGKTNLN